MYIKYAQIESNTCWFSTDKSRPLRVKVQSDKLYYRVVIEIWRGLVILWCSSDTSWSVNQNQLNSCNYSDVFFRIWRPRVRENERLAQNCRNAVLTYHTAVERRRVQRAERVDQVQRDSQQRHGTDTSCLAAVCQHAPWARWRALYRTPSTCRLRYQQQQQQQQAEVDWRHASQWCTGRALSLRQSVDWAMTAPRSHCSTTTPTAHADTKAGLHNTRRSTQRSQSVVYSGRYPRTMRYDTMNDLHWKTGRKLPV